MWWALISQRLSGHISPRGGQGSQDRALEWTQKIHGCWCISEISLLESMRSWHNIAPSAIQTENYVCCARLYDGMKLILAALLISTTIFDTFLSEYKCFFGAIFIVKPVVLLGMYNTVNVQGFEKSIFKNEFWKKCSVFPCPVMIGWNIFLHCSGPGSGKQESVSLPPTCYPAQHRCFAAPSCLPAGRWSGALVSLQKCIWAKGLN